MRKSNYGLYEWMQNISYILKTKLLFPQSRMIRFPIIIRGKKYIDFGSQLTTGRRCRIEVNGKHIEKRLIFGKNVNIGDDVSIRCANRIVIGDNVLMGSGVLIIDNAHGRYSGDEQDIPESAPNSRKLTSAQIVIEDNVWIGERAVIQQGVNIGFGSIVAANSVVTKNIPSNTIVGGVPARCLKIYSEKEKRWVKYEQS